MGPFDLVINAEVVVEDVTAASRVFVDALGFPEQRPSWGSAEPGKGFTYFFARVHPSFKVSPTRIEAMAVSSLDPDADPATTLSFLPALLAAQGARPWKTHGNELATPDIDAVAERLRRNGCPFFTMPGVGGNPFTRLWLGWTGDAPGAYRPQADGGLMLEICETGALMQGPDLWDPLPTPVLQPGSMIRVLERAWLVSDLEQSLRVLEENLAWVPEHRGLDPATGCQRAVMSVNHPRSARVVLLQPVGPGEVSEAVARWGPGAWTITIGVNDLEAKAADLRSRGTAFSSTERADGAPSVRVDTGPLGVPGLFEFAEVVDPPAAT